MKTIATLTLALLLSMASTTARAKLRVVTTTQDLASIADTIGGDRIETFALAKG